MWISRKYGIAIAVSVVLLVCLSVIIVKNGDVTGETEVQSDSVPLQSDTNTSDYIILGNGCFWEREYAYVNVEQRCSAKYPTPHCAHPFGRSDAEVTSVVGYFGGLRVSPSGRVCYHHAGGGADLYSALGHAEATRVRLDPGRRRAQAAALLADFFASFGADGSRPDPGDAGGAYRSVLGLPGGVHSDLYPAAQAARARHGPQMTLRAGRGGEADARGVVWVYDSAALAFHPAELYHQFHSNFGPPTPYEAAYTRTLRRAQIRLGRVGRTACPEAGTHG